MKGPKDKKLPAASAMAGVDLEQVEKLLEFMTAHGLEEFEYEHGGLHVRLRKAASGACAGPIAVRSPGLFRGGSLPAQAGPEETPEPAAVAPAEELHIVKSPIVGTFYGAPSPGGPALCEAWRRRP